MGFVSVEVVDGIPIHKPPYATLTAIDLNKGEHAWQIPLGDTPSIRNHPMLKDLDLPPLGIGPPQHGQSGSLVTAGGVLFISASSPFLYAFDKATGEQLHAIELGGGGFGNPMTYMSSDGRQILAIATSQSDGTDGRVRAFALPK